MRDSLGKLTDPTTFIMNRISKVGKVVNLVSPTKLKEAQTIAESITKKFDRFECKDCAKALSQAFNKA